MTALASLGVLGSGNMGGALIRGALAARLLPPSAVHVFDPQPGSSAPFADLGCRISPSPLDLLASADTIVLAVKPQVFAQVSGEWKRAFATLAGKTLVSVMAGVKTEALRAVFPPSFTVIRAMPNLGLAAGEGATALAEEGASEEALRRAESLFQASGKTVRVPEAQMDAVTGLSGSGPMYVFEFIESLTRGGTASGLSRENAYALALQTAKGALRLLETSSDSPSAWTRRVCSPGGTTERGLRVLEEGGFHALLVQAVEAATARSRELSAGA